MPSPTGIQHDVTSLSASQRQELLRNLLASIDDRSPGAGASAFQQAQQALPRILVIAPPPAAALSRLSKAIFSQLQGLHDQASTGVSQLRQGPTTHGTRQKPVPNPVPGPPPPVVKSVTWRPAGWRLLVVGTLAPSLWLVFALIAAWVTSWNMATSGKRQGELTTETTTLRRDIAEVEETTRASEIELAQVAKQVEALGQQFDAQIAEQESLRTQPEQLEKQLAQLKMDETSLEKLDQRIGNAQAKLETLRREFGLSAKVLEARSAAGVLANFDVPTGDNNVFGHPVVTRQGSRVDVQTGLPLEIVHRATGIAFVLVPAGEFEMGSLDGEAFSQHIERPRHRVKISKAFWVSRYEITQGQYQQVMGNNRSDFSVAGQDSGRVQGLNTSRFPLEKVTWHDCIAFANKLNGLDRPARQPYYRINNGTVEMAGGDGYRLLTEAEWEYVARAGTTTAFPWGDSLSSEQANFDGTRPYGGTANGKSLGRTAPVGSYPANPWGLYDTVGNVWEWVWDRYAGDYKQFASEVAADPQGPAQGVDRVLRGGSWHNSGWVCRPAARFGSNPDDRKVDGAGFRLALGCSGGQPQ
jgi:formylglycine-generating enzyme required for sulfatase activity